MMELVVNVEAVESESAEEKVVVGSVVDVFRVSSSSDDIDSSVDVLETLVEAAWTEVEVLAVMTGDVDDDETVPTFGQSASTPLF